MFYLFASIANLAFHGFQFRSQLEVHVCNGVAWHLAFSEFSFSVFSLLFVIDGMGWDGIMESLCCGGHIISYSRQLVSKWGMFCETGFRARGVDFAFPLPRDAFFVRRFVSPYIASDGRHPHMFILAWERGGIQRELFHFVRYASCGTWNFVTVSHFQFVLRCKHFISRDKHVSPNTVTHHLTPIYSLV